MSFERSTLELTKGCTSVDQKIFYHIFLAHLVGFFTEGYNLTDLKSLTHGHKLLNNI